MIYTQNTQRSVCVLEQVLNEKPQRPLPYLKRAYWKRPIGTDKQCGHASKPWLKVLFVVRVQSFHDPGIGEKDLG